MRQRRGAESRGGPAPADDIDDDVDYVDSGGESLEDGEFDIGLKPIGGGRDGKEGKKRGLSSTFYLYPL